MVLPSRRTTFIRVRREKLNSHRSITITFKRHQQARVLTRQSTPGTKRKKLTKVRNLENTVRAQRHVPIEQISLTRLYLFSFYLAC
jgi:hypothetical protein